MYRLIAALFTTAMLLTACGGKETPAPEQEASAPNQEAAAPLEEPDYEIPMRNFAPFTISGYHVQPMFEEEIVNGHFNIKITKDGEEAEVNAVRFWAGPEDAQGVMIVKTEIENDYHHGHLDIPDPVPAGMKLWIEIETPDGELLKGSTPLEQVA